MAIRPLYRHLLRQAIIHDHSRAQTTSLPTQVHRRGIITTSIPRLPKPTPFVPDVSTFLTLIGRKLSQHADKISSWNDLFSLTTSQLRDLGVEPPRTRRYLLRWLDRFRNGQFGLGGDAKFDNAGKAECRLVELEADKDIPRETESSMTTGSLQRTPGTVRKVLNVPYSGAADATATSQENEAGDTAAGGSATQARSGSGRKRIVPLDASILKQSTSVQGVKHHPGYGIAGSYVRPVKGTQGMIAVIEVQEGMWEQRRGQKVDGGERRKAEVRAKKRAADRKAGRA